MSGTKEIDTLLSQAAEMIIQLDRYNLSKMVSNNERIPIYSWMDEDGTWWTSLEISDTKQKDTNKKRVVKHSNYQGVTKLQKAIRRSTSN